MPAAIAVRIIHAPDSHAVVREVRAATGLSVAEIASAVQTSRPIPILELFGRGHTEGEPIVRALLDALDSADVKFELLIDGANESRAYLSNRIASWHLIAHDIQMETELQLGEPSPEALRWGKRAANDG
jgi:hypothetical protein